MKIGHHRADVARRVVAPKRAALQTLHILAIAGRKLVAVRFVDRVVRPLPRDAHVLVCKNVCADQRIEREAMHAVPGAVNQNS